MSVYDLNHGEEGVKASPGNRKKASFPAWIKSLLSPLQIFKDSIFSPSTGTYKKLIREAKYNGQVIVLKGILNYELENDANLNVVRVEDVPFVVSTFRIGTSSNSSVLPLKIYPQDAIGLTAHERGFDFVVKWPIGYPTSKQVTVKGLVEKYKLYGTTPEFTHY